MQGRVPIDPCEDSRRLAVKGCGPLAGARQRLAGAGLDGAVADHIRRFDPYTFDLRQAVSTLNLESDEDRMDLLRTVARIALIDGSLHERELAYMHILAALMRVQRKVVHLIIRDVKETSEAKRAKGAAAS